MTADPFFRDATGGPAHDRHTRAASDLLARIPGKVLRRIADARAGPWSTRTLPAQRFPAAEIVAMDPSRMHGRSPAGAEDEFDLIVSSADLGLPTLLRRMLPS